MAEQRQIRRGTNTEHSTFTGASGELTVDTTDNTVVVHDSATAGGHPLMKADQSNAQTASTDKRFGDGVKLKFGAGDDLEIRSDGADGVVSRDGIDVVRIDSNGDVTLYEDDGSSTGVNWDASAGDLRVGKDSENTALEGHELRGDGVAYQTASGTAPIKARRNSSEGNIAEFKRDNSLVGLIGSLGYDLTIGNNDVGIRFSDSTDALIPTNVATNSARNNAVSLGTASASFKDMHLGGGLYIGGTGSANYFDDYEEGIFSPALIGVNGGSIPATVTTAGYTKKGREVFISIYFTGIDTTAEDTSGTIRVSNLPFSVAQHAPVSITFCNIAGNGGIGGYCSSGSNQISLTDGTTTSSFNSSDLLSMANGVTMIAGTYITLS